MLAPPTNLILEVPSQLGDLCPVACQGCIPRNVLSSLEPILAPDKIKDLSRQGQAVGVDYVNIYPQQGDLSLD